MEKLKRYKCWYKNLEVLWVDAKSTGEAGEKASREYSKMGCGFVDPLTIEVIEAPRPQAHTRNDPIFGYPLGGTLPGVGLDTYPTEPASPGAVPQQPIGDDEDTPIVDDPWSDLTFLVEDLNNDPYWVLPS